MKYTFVSHNIAKSPVSLAALLTFYSTQPADFICLQEPPWIPIGTQPSQQHAAGTPIKGLPSTPGWRQYLPPVPPRAFPSACILVRDSLPWGAIGLDTTLTIPRYTVALSCGTEAGPFTIISAYLPPRNIAGHPHAEEDLLSLDIPANQNVILCGDFNRHNAAWSPTEWGPSDTRYSGDLIYWFANQGLSVINTPKIVTRHDPHFHNSTIDLVLISPPLLEVCPDEDISILWDRPTASDHAVLEWTWTPLQALTEDPLAPPRALGPLEDKYVETWMEPLHNAFA